MKIKTIAASLLLLAACGCEYRVGDFTMLSSKNVYAKGVDITKLAKTQGVEAQGDMKFLGIGANVKDPLDRALEAGHGNAMIDAVVYWEDDILFDAFKVRGTVVNLPYTPSSAVPSQTPVASAK